MRDFGGSALDLGSIAPIWIPIAGLETLEHKNQ